MRKEETMREKFIKNKRPSNPTHISPKRRNNQRLESNYNVIV
jgi:hypothetical protein